MALEGINHGVQESDIISDALTGMNNRRTNNLDTVARMKEMIYGFHDSRRDCLKKLRRDSRS